MHMESETCAIYIMSLIHNYNYSCITIVEMSVFVVTIFHVDILGMSLVWISLLLILTSPVFPYHESMDMDNTEGRLSQILLTSQGRGLFGSIISTFLFALCFRGMIITVDIRERLK